MPEPEEIKSDSLILRPSTALAKGASSLISRGLNELAMRDQVPSGEKIVDLGQLWAAYATCLTNIDPINEMEDFSGYALIQLARESPFLFDDDFVAQMESASWQVHRAEDYRPHKWFRVIHVDTALLCLPNGLTMSTDDILDVLIYNSNHHSSSMRHSMFMCLYFLSPDGIPVYLKEEYKNRVWSNIKQYQGYADESLYLLARMCSNEEIAEFAARCLQEIPRHNEPELTMLHSLAKKEAILTNPFQEELERIHRRIKECTTYQKYLFE